jgi:hypothetical protein
MVRLTVARGAAGAAHAPKGRGRAEMESQESRSAGGRSATDRGGVALHKVVKGEHKRVRSEKLHYGYRGQHQGGASGRVESEGGGLSGVRSERKSAKEQARKRSMRGTKAESPENTRGRI